MIRSPIDAEKIRAYLLGDHHPQDIDLVEDAYFASDAARDDVAAVEQEMIEDYLAGRLAPGERGVFESRYLETPPHRRRVAIVRGLQRRARPRRRALSYLPLAIAATIVMAAALGIVALRGLRTGDGQAARGRPSPGTSSGSGVAASVAITLSPIQVRGEGETPTIEVRDGVTSITLRLERPFVVLSPRPDGSTGEASSYRLTLRTVEGAEVWSGQAPPANGWPRAGEPALFTTVTVPAPALGSGDYVVVLADSAPGGSEIQRYFLRVRRPARP